MRVDNEGHPKTATSEVDGGVKVRTEMTMSDKGPAGAQSQGDSTSRKKNANPPGGEGTAGPKVDGDEAQVDSDDEADNPLNADLLESSFALLAPHAEALVSRFYFRLFRAAPETYYMFPQERFSEQQKKLLAALKLTVNTVRKPEALVPVLEDLGAKHTGYGTEPEHYELVGSILLATLAEFAGPAWTSEIEKAWVDAYGVIQGVMLAGAARRIPAAAA